MTAVVKGLHIILTNLSPGMHSQFRGPGYTAMTGISLNRNKAFVSRLGLHGLVINGVTLCCDPALYCHGIAVRTIDVDLRGWYDHCMSRRQQRRGPLSFSKKRSGTNHQVSVLAKNSSWKTTRRRQCILEFLPWEISHNCKHGHKT